MTRSEIEQHILAALGRVAPEIDPRTVRRDVGFRDQFDLDSVDLLNFMIALHDEVGVEVPEADYQKIATLNGAVDYLDARLREVRT